MPFELPSRRNNTKKNPSPGLFQKLGRNKRTETPGNAGQNAPKKPFRKLGEIFKHANTPREKELAKQDGEIKKETRGLLARLREDVEASKKPEYELSLELDTKKSPEVVEKQKNALNSLSEKQRQLFEKKGLVAGMYSLSVEQRKQFQESGIAREFRGQAEEKMAEYFGYKGHENITYRDLPKSMKRDMLLGNLYMDDFLPDNIGAELNRDISTIKDLQQVSGSSQTSWPRRRKIFRRAKDLRERYEIQPKDFQDYLREGGQDNGLLAGVFSPLLQSLPPQQLQQLGVDSVQNFRQRNTPVLSSNTGGGGGGSRGIGGGGGESYSSGGYSGGGGERGFSTPSVSSSAGEMPDPSIISSLPGDFKTNMGFWDASKVAEVRKNGGIWINMDCNQSDGRKVIPPLIVIPDDASPEMRAAAQAYVNAMAQLHNEKFGRDFTGKVKTRGQNGRGRSNTIHTEAWSIDDTQMVDFLKSEEGIQQYRQILASTLGKIPGAVFSLPHGERDPGAVNSRGESEVSLAKIHLSGFSASPETPAGAETTVAETGPTSEVPTQTQTNVAEVSASPEAPTPTVVVLSGDDTTPSALTTEQATKYYGPQT